MKSNDYGRLANQMARVIGGCDAEVGMAMRLIWLWKVKYCEWHIWPANC